MKKRIKKFKMSSQRKKKSQEEKRLESKHLNSNQKMKAKFLRNNNLRLRLSISNIILHKGMQFVVFLKLKNK